MTASDISAAFYSLKVGAIDTQKLPATLLPERKADYLARGERGQPLILLAHDGPKLISPPIRLRHLSVQFDAFCRVTSNNQLVEGAFVVVECDAEDPTLYRFFLSASEAMLIGLPLKPSAEEIRARINGFVELFRALTIPSARTLKGLWAELLVIASSNDPSAWIAAWHSRANDKYDFSFPGRKVDVKAAESSRRAHDFAIDQLEPPHGARANIISILLRRDVAGPDLLDLATEIVTKLPNQVSMAQKVWMNLAEVVGKDLDGGLDGRFDRQHARQTLRVISADMVPRPSCADSRVSNIRFTVDISDEAAEADHEIDVFTQKQ